MNEGHIWIDEQITPETYAMVKQRIAEFQGKDTIVLHIASPGGSVYAGYKIKHALKLSGKKLKGVVEGEAQSMASYLAVICDELEICNPSVFMIHMPHSGVEGTAENFEQGANELRTIENDMIEAYAAKSKKTPDEIREMMRKTTSLNAKQAVEFGFADRMLAHYTQAVALGQTIKKPMEKKESVLTKIIHMAATALGVPQAMDYKTADGKTLSISEDGKTATIDGQPATGSIALADGRTVIAENGAVISIQEAATAPNPAPPAAPPAPAPAQNPVPQTAQTPAPLTAEAQLAAVQAENAKLKADKEAAEQAKTAAEAEKTKTVTALALIKTEMEALKDEPIGDQVAPSRGLVSTMSPSARGPIAAQEKDRTMRFIKEHMSWLFQYYPEGEVAKYASGPNAVSILETNFNYTWPGILTTEIFYKPTLQAPALSDLFMIDQGIKDKKRYNLVTQLDKILQPYTGCTRVFNGNRQLITNTTVQTKEFQVSESWCKDDFTGYLTGQFNILAQEWLKTGNRSFDPSGTPINTIIDKLLIDALQRDVARRAFFGAGNSSDSDYNQIDGLWDRLIDSSGASNYCVVRAGAALGTGALAAGAALTALEAVYANSNILLKNAPGKKFTVTRSIWDNYYNSLIGTGAVTEQAFENLQKGLTTLTYKGIPVIPVDVWDLFLSESDNPLFATTRHLILLTIKDNHILGVEQGSDLNKIEGWYERKDRKFYYEADMKFGYNYLHCDLQTIAY